MAATAKRASHRVPLPAVLIACATLLAITMTLGVGIGPVYLSPGAVWQVMADHLVGHPSSTSRCPAPAPSWRPRS